MLQADVIAAPASRPLARLDKRAADDRLYVIDCEPLLRQHELMAKVSAVRAVGVEATNARTRAGRYVSVRLARGGGNGAHSDGRLSVDVVTSMGTLEVCIAVRVHG